MIKIFTRKTKELTSDIDTWIVVWKTYKYQFLDGTHPHVQKCYQAFTDKQEAEEYAENYHCVYENRKQYYQTWSKRFKKERDRLARKIAKFKCYS